MALLHSFSCVVTWFPLPHTPWQTLHGFLLSLIHFCQFWSSWAHSSCRVSVHLHICLEHGCARLLCIWLFLLVDCRSLPFTVTELNWLYVYFLSPLLLWYFSHATTCTSSLCLDLTVPHAAYPYTSSFRSTSFLCVKYSFIFPWASLSSRNFQKEYSIYCIAG